MFEVMVGVKEIIQNRRYRIEAFVNEGNIDLLIYFYTSLINRKT